MTTLPVESDPEIVADLDQPYRHAETRDLVALVTEAAERVRTDGEAAFPDFRRPASRWRTDDTYVFVLDPEGLMLVHPDPGLEGSETLDLEDVNGRPIIRGLISAVTSVPDKPEGWYHYQWPVPGQVLPRWKSSYARLVYAPSGEGYIVAGGIYDDRMERAFVVDIVDNAIGEIERRGERAFARLRDPTGPYMAKDAYVFVFDLDGVELVNPAFPNLEGRDMGDARDTRGKPVVREMLDVVRSRDSGWVDYMWPRPGDSVSTQKSTYVRGATLGDRRLLVGCGVYLADAPREAPTSGKLTAPELRTRVREAAALLEKKGERAYAELRTPGSKWFRDETYVFVLTLDGIRAFHAGGPDREGQNDRGLEDVVGRPFIDMMLEAGASPSGEGWVHYMYPRPGSLFPAWKSSFVKRVIHPSGTPHIVGCGIYDLEMDRALIEDVVDRAAALVEERGRDAFGRLRDRTGPFVFMDTYVFVHTPDGTELVNPAFPSLEGRNLGDLRDVRGNEVAREQTAAALRDGAAWLEFFWYRPGGNVPARKPTYVRKAESGGETFIVGSGIYAA